MEQGAQCRPSGVAAGAVGVGRGGFRLGGGTPLGGFQVEFPATGVGAGAGGFLLLSMSPLPLGGFVSLALEPAFEPEDFEQREG